jgi:hypothetical protein
MRVAFREGMQEELIEVIETQHTILLSEQMQKIQQEFSRETINLHIQSPASQIAFYTTPNITKTCSPPTAQS